jgi:hypothetical protein
MELYNFLRLWLRLGTSAVVKGMLPDRIDILSMHRLNMSDDRTPFSKERAVTLSPAADRLRCGYGGEWCLPYHIAVTSVD